MSEMSWRTNPVVVSDWIKKYLNRRYGKHNPDAYKAWMILSQNVLNSKTAHFNMKVLLTKMPSLNMKDYTWYNFADVALAFDNLLLAAPDLKNEKGFR